MTTPTAALDDFEGMQNFALEPKPFVHRTEETLSLHFHLNVVQSEMRHDAPEELVLAYTRTMMGFLLFNPRPRRILMIGLGGGSIPKYCYAKLPETTIVVVEINPHVIALRDTFRVPADDARFVVICQDGADFVRDVSSLYDVLLIDGFAIAGRSPQLCRQRFFDDCYRNLAPEGLLVVNFGAEDRHHDPLVSRIRRSFKNPVVVVESEDLANRIAFARKSAGLSLTREQFIRRLDEFDGPHAMSLRGTLDGIRYEPFTSLAASLSSASMDNAEG